MTKHNGTKRSLKNLWYFGLSPFTIYKYIYNKWFSSYENPEYKTKEYLKPIKLAFNILGDRDAYEFSYRRYCTYVKNLLKRQSERSDIAIGETEVIIDNLKTMVGKMEEIPYHKRHLNYKILNNYLINLNE